MKKSGFDALPKARKVAAAPKLSATSASALSGYGAARAIDGRVARRTGRDAALNTIITPELKARLKQESARIGKPIGGLLDDMWVAYEEKHGRNRS